MPENSFGYVPTPALVAPIEFTLRVEDYAGLGGHMDSIVKLERVLAEARTQSFPWSTENPWPLAPQVP